MNFKFILETLIVSINPRVFIFQDTPLFCLASFHYTYLSLSHFLSMPMPPSTLPTRIHQALLYHHHHPGGTNYGWSAACADSDPNPFFLLKSEPLLFSKSEPPLPATLMLCFGEESEADRTNMNAREGEHGGGDGGGDQLKKYRRMKFFRWDSCRKSQRFFNPKKFPCDECYWSPWFFFFFFFLFFFFLSYLPHLMIFIICFWSFLLFSFWITWKKICFWQKLDWMTDICAA